MLLQRGPHSVKVGARRQRILHRPGQGVVRHTASDEVNPVFVTSLIPVTSDSSEVHQFLPRPNVGKPGSLLLLHTHTQNQTVQLHSVGNSETHTQAPS